MAKESHIEVDGIIIEQLPNAIFRVKLANEYIVTAHIGGKMRMNFIKLLKGDKVRLAISSYDLSRGRITYRY